MKPLLQASGLADLVNEMANTKSPIKTKLGRQQAMDLQIKNILGLRVECFKILLEKALNFLTVPE